MHSLQCATHRRYGNARRDERDDGIDDDGDASRGGVSWDDRATDDDEDDAGDRGCGGKERQDPEELWVSYDRADDARDGDRDARWRRCRQRRSR